MNDQRHVIKRQILELEVQGQEQAQPLMTEAARLYRQRIVPIIDQQCTTLSAPDQLHRIERLEVDLGIIDPEHFATDFLAKVTPALRQALTEAITLQAQGAAGQAPQSKTASQLELFTTFVRTGYLPWWADAAQPRLLEDALAHLIQSAPAALRRLMRNVAQERRHLQRIVNHYTDESLTQLSSLLAPSLFASSTEIPQDLMVVLAQIKGTTAMQPAALRQTIWANILHITGLSGTYDRSPEAIWRAVLKRVATNLELPFGELIAHIQQILTTSPGDSRGHLQQIIATLHLELLKADMTSAATSDPETTDLAALIRALEQWQRTRGPLPHLGMMLRSVVTHLPQEIQAPLTDILEEISSDKPGSQAQLRSALTRIARLLRGVTGNRTLPPTPRQEIVAVLAEIAATLDRSADEFAQPAEDELSGETRHQPDVVLPDAAALTVRLTQLESRINELVPHLSVTLKDGLLGVIRELRRELSERGTVSSGVLHRLRQQLQQVFAGQELAPSLRQALLSALQELAIAAGISFEETAKPTQLPPDELKAVLSARIDNEGTTDEIRESGTTTSSAPDDWIARLDQLETAFTELGPQLPAPLRDALLSTLSDLRRELVAYEKVPSDFLHRLRQQLQQAFAQESLPISVPQELLTALQALSTVAGVKSAELAELMQMSLEEPIDPTEQDVIEDEPLIDLPFSDADEIYINNAGLVILWPFLNNFFARLGLVEEKAFVDGTSRQRAVGLLQVLASGESTLLEYLLPLNKVLCGMELTEVFDFGPPLTPAEAEECTDLLGAVIEQAPVLRNMSMTGLQGTFLLRPGVLRTRDGLWLLQVERETYDVVLDRFPWSWAWVKLPWMDAPLRVEW